jgi:RHS repeat-associated protein
VCLTASRSTGKERDSESGLDYFGARHYSSTMGRFMSPDWSAKPEAVPYSDLDNPQSLNLYGYAGNNPLSITDPDGHCWAGWLQGICDTWQRVENAFGGFGWHTNAQVDDILTNDRKFLNQNTQIDLEKLTDKQVYQVTNAIQSGKDSVISGSVKFILQAATFKVPVPGLSGKEGAKNAPEWAKGNKPQVGENGKQFAKRLMDEKYGPGNWNDRVGPGQEFNQIQKWGDRAFQDPPGTGK